MNREDAHQFIQLYEAFMTAEAVKITDIDPARREIEIQSLDGSGTRRWYDYWDAAKVIEAKTCSEPA